MPTNRGLLLHTTGHVSNIVSVKLAQDSRTLISASLDNKIMMWSTSSGTLIREFTTSMSGASFCLSCVAEMTVFL